MSTLFRPSSERAQLRRFDLGLLDVRDRACLRLLNRVEVATPTQLAVLIYPSRRTSFRHLQRLWHLGLVDRAPILPIRGGIPIAYRLSRRGMNQLGYTDRRLGGIGRLRHQLDVVASVCALVRSEPDLVQAWLPESITADAGLEPAHPDSVVALQGAGGSAVLCLEIDEGTEHAPQIRAKLATYSRVLPDRPGWRVLFAVPTADRLAWLRRAARSEAALLTGRLWAVVLGDLEALGLNAPVTPLGGSRTSAPLWSLLNDPRPRRCPTPVGSNAWVTLLGSGGGEDLDEALR
jgi:Replication-relaxation